VQRQRVEWRTELQVFIRWTTVVFILYLTPTAPFHYKLEGKYSLESTDPRESEIRAHMRPYSLLSELTWECITYLLCVKWFVCLFVYIGNVCLHWKKNPRFTAFLDNNLHTWLAIVTENELGLAFPRRNLPKKFRPDPSTFYVVIVVTNRQTDRQTDRQPTPVKT